MNPEAERGYAAALVRLMEERRGVVAVMGLGYVGLPLVRTFLAAGFECVGYDVDTRKIDLLSDGRSYIDYLGGEWISETVSAGRFHPTSNPQDLGRADALLICVPTPLSESRDPDLSYVERTAETIARVLRPGQLVILESTTYPGTTRDVMIPVLESSGLKAGVDFLVAYSPEREDPGNRDFTTTTIPKVVGGLDDASLQAAVALYGAALAQIVPVSTLEVAEACKILENTYRAVNIALVNELKMLFERMGIDVWEVIDAASTKPFGFQRFTPGPGLGGHCIPIDPFYLSWAARKHGTITRFIELAGEINEKMPEYVLHKLMDALNDDGKSVKGSRVCIAGVAYKPNVDDPRESPAFRLMELLTEKGAELSYIDPHIAELPKMRSFETPAMKASDPTPDFLASVDALVVVTNHDALPWGDISRFTPLIVDTRNAVEAGAATGRVVRA